MSGIEKVTIRLILSSIVLGNLQLDKKEFEVSEVLTKLTDQKMRQSIDHRHDTAFELIFKWRYDEVGHPI